MSRPLIYCGDLVLLSSLHVGIVSTIAGMEVRGKIVNTDETFEVDNNSILVIYRRLESK
jgi:hypothetical protein